MRVERLGHTKSQLDEHQIGLSAENDEEIKWLGEFVSEYHKGKPLYIVGFSESEIGIKSLSISVRE